MQQEIAVRVNALVTERWRYAERAAVDDRTRLRSHHGRNVAHRAADGIEQQLALLGRGGRSEGDVPWRHLGTAQDQREVINVRQAEAVWHVLRVRGHLTDRRDVLR